MTGLFSLAVLLADSMADSLQALVDAVGGGNIAMAIVAGVLFVGVVVLKVLGKSLPFVDPLVEAVLSVAKKLTAKPPPAANSATEKKGLAAVVELKKDGEK